MFMPLWAQIDVDLPQEIPSEVWNIPQSLSAQPLYLNECTPAQLYACGYFTTTECELILQYRQLNGYFNHLQELVHCLIPIEKIETLKPFLRTVLPLTENLAAIFKLNEPKISGQLNQLPSPNFDPLNVLKTRLIFSPNSQVKISHICFKNSANFQQQINLQINTKTHFQQLLLGKLVLRSGNGSICGEGFGNRNPFSIENTTYQHVSMLLSNTANIGLGENGAAMLYAINQGRFLGIISHKNGQFQHQSLGYEGKIGQNLGVILQVHRFQMDTAKIPQNYTEIGLNIPRFLGGRWSLNLSQFNTQFNGYKFISAAWILHPSLTVGMWFQHFPVFQISPSISNQLKSYLGTQAANLGLDFTPFRKTIISFRNESIEPIQFTQFYDPSAVKFRQLVILQSELRRDCPTKIRFRREKIWNTDNHFDYTFNLSQALILSKNLSLEAGYLMRWNNYAFTRSTDQYWEWKYKLRNAHLSLGWHQFSANGSPIYTTDIYMQGAYSYLVLSGTGNYASAIIQQKLWKKAWVAIKLQKMQKIADKNEQPIDPSLNYTRIFVQLQWK